MTRSILYLSKTVACAAVVLAAFTSCNESDKKSEATASTPKAGFNKRGDIEVGDDGLARLKSMTTPYSGQIVMRNKQWQIGYLASYQDGKLNGPEIRYFPDGITLMRWYDWVHGEKVRHRHFYENGHIQIDAMMKNGEAFGSHRTWAEDGLLRFDGNFAENLQWDGRVRDVNENGEVLWDAIFDHGRYVSGTYPKDHEQKLIDGGMLDPKTLQPIPKKDAK